jgi:hypothetical protein
MKIDFCFGPDSQFRVGNCQPRTIQVARGFTITTVRLPLTISRISPSPIPAHYYSHPTMATRTSGNTTALRRLMTEYKQLTASGLSPSVLSVFHDLAEPSRFQARLMACSQLVRDASSSRTLPTHPSIHKIPVYLLCTHDLYLPQVLYPNLTSSPGRPSFAGQRIRPL